MTTLHLGVIVVPYSAVGEKSSMDTGDVASILEDKYDVMEHFVDLHQQEIADFVADSLVGALENLMAGAPAGADPFGSGTSKIEAMFHHYIESEEIAKTGESGVPTEAALKGTSLRRSRKYAKGPRRPSFVFSGLYEGTFKAWMT